jgi:hypothetical protein
MTLAQVSYAGFGTVDPTEEACDVGGRTCDFSWPPHRADRYSVHAMTDPASRDLLTHQARRLLSNVLSQVDFSGSDELRQQVSSVIVVGGPVTMLDLRLMAPTHGSAFRHGPAPLSAIVSDADGTSVGELLVWVENGYLQALEFAWWSDDPPERLPDPEHVRVART